MKRLVLICLLCVSFTTKAQVGVNNTNPQATIDITASNITNPANNDGILIPRIDQFPATNPTAQQHSMIVYLTTTVGSNTPGFYYWDNTTTTWLPFSSSSTSNYWALTGNSATNPTTNFVGTTDTQDLVFRTDNTEQARILTNGNLGVGLNNPSTRIEAVFNPLDNFATIKATGIYDAHGYLGVQGQTGFDGITTANWNGQEIGVTGISVGTSTTDNFGVIGHSNYVGIRAEHTNGTNWAELGTTNYGGAFNGRVELFSTTDASGVADTGVLEIGNSLRIDGNEVITNTDTQLYLQNGNNGDLSVDSSTLFVDASTNRVGIGDTTPDAKLDIETTVNNEYGIFARSQNGTGAFLMGDNVDPINSGWWFCFGSGAVACGGNETNFAGHAGLISGGRGVGVFGLSELDTDATTDHAGGNFVTKTSTNGVRAFSSVGADINGTVFKIIGFGTVSTIVEDEEGVGRIMHAPESPEALFQDYGEGQLVNGKATITLDPILSKNIVVNDQHPLRVFIQLQGDCKGTYVTNQSVNGFEVIELQSGTSNAKFSWSVTANRKDQIIGGIVSKYENLRFEKIKSPLHKVSGIDNSSEENNENIPSDLEEKNKH